MRRKKHFLLLLLAALSTGFTRAQSATIIGHQELIGYFNPALISGANGQVSYLYRYQWDDIGPSTNTLFFKYPVKSNGKIYSPHAIGLVFQHEDFNLISRTKLEFFMSNTLVKFDKFRIGAGLNAGLSFGGINTDDFNLEELIDPELANVDKRLSVANKLGLSVHHRLVDFGISARFINAQTVADYHSSLSFKVPLSNSKFRLNPIAVMRMTDTFEYQLEGQLKSTYDDKVSLTAGYRQNFGAIFQLSLRFNNSKASYGVETPNGDVSSLGLTHELLGSYYFESPALVQHRKDSIIKVRRDSVNRVRVERYRQQQLEKVAGQDSLSRLKIAEKQDIEDKTIPKVVIKNKEDIYSSLEDLSGKASDNARVILDHIGFEPGLYLLTPDSYKELDKLYNYISHHKSLHLEIQGHTDNSGSPETNLALSRYRALAVFNYLISKGIDVARMNVVGYGENQPLFPNSTPENRELNRRIEIVFIKK
jgi:type IX secretion system PorP/SprF family membrane protein